MDALTRLPALEVKPSGSLTAPILILGEAPGEQEARALVPFVGPSGKLLGEWLNAVGLNRSLCRVDNVYRFRPPNNKLEQAPKGEVEESARLLHSRLRKLTGLRLIIPMGNYALRALLRKPLWSNAAENPRISEWRGSFLDYDHPSLGAVAVLPTYHPAATFRQPTLTNLCLADWKKAAELLRSGRRPQSRRAHIIEPKRAQVREFEAKLEAEFARRPKGARLTFDIETNPPAREIICVGFALNPEESITLKWSSWRRTIKRWLEHPIRKVGQNAYVYDRFWLHFHGIDVVNFYDDTLCEHHALRPSYPHGLADQASLYIPDQPFWKAQPKDSENIKAMRTPYRALAHYCGIDCTTTSALDLRHRKELKGK